MLSRPIAGTVPSPACPAPIDDDSEGSLADATTPAEGFTPAAAGTEPGCSAPPQPDPSGTPASVDEFRRLLRGSREAAARSGAGKLPA